MQTHLVKACSTGVVRRLPPSGVMAEDFKAVPELGYRVNADFFHGSERLSLGEASGIALNSKRHIFLFQRARPMLTEYDASGNFLRSIGEGLFMHPHGLRIDPDDNIWTTDGGSHLVLKLSPAGGGADGAWAQGRRRGSRLAV